ncbi:Sec-independent protein translocase protein TatB [Loktanella agnita]|uniref:Sec-independent protein translocase protein TatB n=1 Tax=Loktanella agnita TaxID=287097 RepID=UPI003985F789
MFGLGMSEMVLIGIVALIVIGPKDLPGMFRTLGQFTGKARGMAREFSRAMEAAADEAGVKDISNTIKTAANPKQFGVDKIKDATGMAKGPETQTLSEERQAAKEKMSAAMGKAAEERHAREAAEAAAETTAPEADK